MKQESPSPAVHRHIEPMFQFNVMEISLHIGWMLASIMVVASLLLLDSPASIRMAAVFALTGIWAAWLRFGGRNVTSRRELEHTAWCLAVPLGLVACAAVWFAPPTVGVIGLSLAIGFAASVYVSDLAFIVFATALLVVFASCRMVQAIPNDTLAMIQFVIILVSGLIIRVAVQRVRQNNDERQLKETRLRMELETAASQLKAERDEREQSETTLRTQQIQLDAIISRSLMTLCIWDKSGRCLQMRGNGLAKIGLLPENVVNNRFDVLFGDNSNMMNGFRLAGDGNGSSVRAELAPGAFYEIQFQPVYDQSGNLSQIVSIAFDVTESVTSESERRLLEQRSFHEQRMESLSSLAGGVAHDFNNYLMAIVAFSESVSSDLQNKDSMSRDDIDHLRMTAAEIRKTAVNAAGVCQQMLMVAGKSRESRSLLDLGQLLPDWEEMLSATLGGNVELKMVPADDPLWVNADDLMVQRALFNVVKNAADAIGNQPEGMIEIQLFEQTYDDQVFPRGEVFGQFQRGRKYIVVRVTDNGGGMDDATIKRIFDPYFSTKATGHGFGLAITNGIVTSHGGFIHCQSEVDKGTKLDLLFPAASAKAKQVSKAESRETLPTRGKRLLVVDDEQSVRDSVGMVLRSAGNEVLLAESGQEAIDVICREPAVDCIILDYSMPDLNGLEVLQRIREMGHATPVILCSGYMIEEDARGLPKPEECLTKPYKFAELHETIDRVCGRSSSSQGSGLTR